MFNIFIIDDSKLIRDELTGIVKLYCSKNEIEVNIHTAESEKESEALMEKEKPDVVFLDIMLIESKSAGMTILRILKEKFPCKIFVISALPGDKVKEACMVQGADGYIEKPFSAKEIDVVLGEMSLKT